MCCIIWIVGLYECNSSFIGIFPPKSVWDKWINRAILQYDICSFDSLTCWIQLRVMNTIDTLVNISLLHFKEIILKPSFPCWHKAICGVQEVHLQRLFMHVLSGQFPGQYLWCWSESLSWLQKVPLKILKTRSKVHIIAPSKLLCFNQSVYRILK